MASNNDKFMPPNLFGRGRITNVTKYHAFVQDSHERSVFVPSYAVLNPRCNDLTQKFDINEEVIFAAKKQIPPKGNTEYQATSIVKKEDLQSEKGRISAVSNGQSNDMICNKNETRWIPLSCMNDSSNVEAVDKHESAGELACHTSRHVAPSSATNANTVKIEETYGLKETQAVLHSPGNANSKASPGMSTCAFGETSRGVKVFIPFTARNENDQEWRMRGASEGAPCEFGLMPQVEKSDCRFLAATIVLTGENKNKVNVPTASANNKPRNPVAPHWGIVLPYKGSKCVYSAQTGYAMLSSPLNDTLKLGAWVKYDVCETPDNNFNWMATNVNTWQQPDKVQVKVDKADAIRVETNALVCRVDKPRAWFWNDFLGRMCQEEFTSQFQPKTVVQVIAKYAPGGALNDTNWKVECVELTSQDERKTCAQKLETSGIWKVTSVTHISEEKFTATMQSKIRGVPSTCCMLWMDVVGSCAPKIGEFCRAAVIRQYLPYEGALPYRAVLVFPAPNPPPLSSVQPPRSSRARSATPSSHQSLNQEPKPAMPKKEMNPPPSVTQKAAESNKFKCPKSEEVEKESKNAQLVRIFKEILSDDELFKQIFMRFPQHAEAFSEVMKS